MKKKNAGTLMIIAGVILVVTVCSGLPEQIQELKGADIDYAIGGMLASFVLLSIGLGLAIGGYKMAKAAD